MAFFKTEEEKAQIAAEKEQKLLSKYGLEDLRNESDVQSVKKIANELLGTGFMEAGVKLGGGSEKDLLKVQMNYQRAILEQNFIMLRQLDRIASLLQEK